MLQILSRAGITMVISEFRDVHASRAKTAFSHPFISPRRSLRKCYPTVGVQHGDNVAVIHRFDKAGSHQWCYLPSTWRPLPARGFHLAHSAKHWMWKEQSVWELLILSPWWDCFFLIKRSDVALP